jgi:hypothetical protein
VAQVLPPQPDHAATFIAADVDNVHEDFQQAF